MKTFETSLMSSEANHKLITFILKGFALCEIKSLAGLNGANGGFTLICKTKATR